MRLFFAILLCKLVRLALRLAGRGPEADTRFSSRAMQPSSRRSSSPAATKQTSFSVLKSEITPLSPAAQRK